MFGLDRPGRTRQSWGAGPTPISHRQETVAKVTEQVSESQEAALWHLCSKPKSDRTVETMSLPHLCSRHSLDL